MDRHGGVVMHNGVVRHDGVDIMDWTVRERQVVVEAVN